jgi:hypothetical protein
VASVKLFSAQIRDFEALMAAEAAAAEVKEQTAKEAAKTAISWGNLHLNLQGVESHPPASQSQAKSPRDELSAHDVELELSIPKEGLRSPRELEGKVEVKTPRGEELSLKSPRENDGLPKSPRDDEGKLLRRKMLLRNVAQKVCSLSSTFLDFLHYNLSRESRKYVLLTLHRVLMSRRSI